MLLIGIVLIGVISYLWIEPCLSSKAPMLRTNISI
jgi:hypothetical protein